MAILILVNILIAVGCFARALLLGIETVERNEREVKAEISVIELALGFVFVVNAIAFINV